MKNNRVALFIFVVILLFVLVVIVHRESNYPADSTSRTSHSVVESVGLLKSKCWELIPGDSLKDSLTRWAKTENWNLVFLLDKDVKIDVPAIFHGNLLEAVEQAINSYKEKGIVGKFEIHIYANNVISITQ